MDYTISCTTPSFLNRFSLKNTLIPYLSFQLRGNFTRQRIISARESNSRKVRAADSAGGSQCGEHFSCLNMPLEPNSAAGKFFAGILLDRRECFPLLVKEQLEQFAVDRSHTIARMSLTVNSDETYLYRRIAELKQQECQTAVHDLMYLLICYKFYSIRVHLVPRLSKCINNGRLEICPSSDWELESIHSLVGLEIIKEHLAYCVGWKVNSSVTSLSDRIQVPRLKLYRVYTASVLFGYFLKSVSFRHNLEQIVCPNNFDLTLPLNRYDPFSDLLSSGSKTVYFDLPKEQDLKYYLLGFDKKRVQMCSTPKSKEAINLIESHCHALFGDETTGSIVTNDVISTSFATLKRIVLEAIAFGYFLWETEQYIDNVYELQEN